MSKEIEKAVACEPDEAQNPAVLVQMLTIMADNTREIPPGYLCTMTAGVQHYEPMGRLCFVLAIKAMPQ